MRKILALFMSCLICFIICGCNKPNSSSYSSSEIVIYDNESEVLIKDADITPSNSKDNNVSSESIDVDDKTAASTPETSSKKQSSKLPEVFCSKNDSKVFYSDLVALTNGGFAAVGYVDDCSFIRTYDSQLNIVTANYKLMDYGIGSTGISQCEDGGFIFSVPTNNYLVKVSNDLKKEWVANYEPVEGSSHMHDVEQISSDCYAVLFDSVYEGPRALKVALIDDKGNLIIKKEIMAQPDFTNANIIADGKGGFYVTATCNQSTAEMFAILKDVYNASKNSEVAVMHFSDKYELDWATTFGGNGNDWCEEGTVDSNGNIYVAICTDSVETDKFWSMEIDFLQPYRRMLVKLDNNGKIVYTCNLSNKGSATYKSGGVHVADQVVGIGVHNDTVYVVGLANYFDGIQDKYECKQISSVQNDQNVSCVYTVAINKDGKEISRDIYKCGADEELNSAIVLKNGTVVICGSILASENAFNLALDQDENRSAALFAYKK